MKPERPPLMGIVDATDPGHVRFTAEQAHHIGDVMQGQERRIVQLERELAACRVQRDTALRSAELLADENAKLAAALKNQETPK